MIWNEIVPVCPTYQDFIQHGRQGAYAFTGRVNAKTGLRDRVKAYYRYEEPWTRNPDRIRAAAREFFGPGGARAVPKGLSRCPEGGQGPRNLWRSDSAHARVQVTWTPDLLLEAARGCDSFAEFTAKTGGGYEPRGDGRCWMKSS